MSAIFKACFAAGTPMLTPDGSKPIEQIREGDLVLSRDENDPDGPVVAKVVEEVFVRKGRILHLHVGGQVIRTTPEHPFYKMGEGWVDAFLLKAGDYVKTREGVWAQVEEVHDTGEYETVYNMRVADFHTYFVDSCEWDFSVWAHNAYQINDKKYRDGYDAIFGKKNLNSNNAKSAFGLYEIKVNDTLHKIGKADLNRVTQSSGLPTRLHQQVRKLEDIHGVGNVSGKVVQDLGNVTTQQAKLAETARLQKFFDATGIIPPGNIKSFKPA